ncbi:hypothetical protein FCH83_07360 [Pseudomonas putida]|nr:hypothetical protein [Pseudomonas putida]NTZ01189.1 hypothetical protein [Pseudomonas putida]NTZ22462.1 hypothetical protein [Pseudomonas putida]NTZ55272.1 hypothetical protein [Pseudomonas putida]NTZ64914.1 hypothetical protein [Pseudomonas putida]
MPVLHGYCGNCHCAGLHCPICGSGLVSRLGCKAAPAICASALKPRGCSAAQSRHKAAPTGPVHASGEMPAE